MSKPTEVFQHAIRVGWGDCDPARIAYTARIPEWAIEAIDAWWEFTTGLDWYALNIDRGFGTPFAHMTLDFRHPVTPRHPLLCKVQLLKLGNSSLRHRVVGSQGRVLCFEGEFVSVFVKSASLKPVSPPDDLREMLAAQG